MGYNHVNINGDDYMRITKAPDERKAEIIEVAKGLFLNKGIDKTSVNEIVRNVGVAQGLFYYYFKTKQEVVEAVIDDLIEDMIIDAKSILQDSYIDFYEKIRKFIRTFFSLVLNDRGAFATDFHLPKNKELRQDAMNKAIKLMSPYMVDVVEKGVKEGKAKVKYPRSTVIMLFYGICTMTHEEELTEEVILSMVEQSLGIKHGILTSSI